MVHHVSGYAFIGVIMSPELCRGSNGIHKEVMRNILVTHKANYYFSFSRSYLREEDEEWWDYYI